MKLRPFLLGERDESELRKIRAIEEAISEFNRCAPHLVADSDLDALRELFIRCTVEAQMQVQAGEEFYVLDDMESLLRAALRRPSKNIRRDWFRDI
jgi:hypothetical protein